MQRRLKAQISWKQIPLNIAQLISFFVASNFSWRGPKSILYLINSFQFSGAFHDQSIIIVKLFISAKPGKIDQTHIFLFWIKTFIGWFWLRKALCTIRSDSRSSIAFHVVCFVLKLYSVLGWSLHLRCICYIWSFVSAALPSFPPGSLPCGFNGSVSKSALSIVTPGWPDLYKNYENCEWVLHANTSAYVLEVVFESFDTESSFDYLSVSNKKANLKLGFDVSQVFAY